MLEFAFCINTFTNLGKDMFLMCKCNNDSYNSRTSTRHIKTHMQTQLDTPEHHEVNNINWWGEFLTGMKQ